MNFTNYDVRRYARERLNGNWLKGALITIIVAVIGGVLAGINFIWRDLIILGAALDVVIAIVLIPLQIGIMFVYLRFSRGDTLEYSGLTYGYKNGMFLKSIGLTIMTGIFTFLWTLLFIIPGIIKAISYSLASYVLIDNPNLGWRECLNESKKLTNGCKGQIFLLGLSFIGWMILGALTAGILYLFIVPYMQTSFANFYDRRRIDIYGLPQEAEPVQA